MAEDDFITEIVVILLMLCFMSLEKKKEKDVKDCAKEDVMEVVMETRFMLATFDRFYDPNVILYFISKLPLLLWKGFRDLFIMSNCVHHVYVVRRGFYDVVFQS